jgi:heat shock protein HslJ
MESVARKLMILRILVITIIFSVNAYAKPAQHATTSQEKNNPSQTISPASEDGLTKELTSHNWQISNILVKNNFTLKDDQWLFSFNKAGQYKAFGACNYLTGKFSAENNGTFRLGKLETSLNECPASKDEEIMVMNMLLMADSFAISGDTLLFKSGSKVMMELKPSNQDINTKMTKKSQDKKGKKAAKSKAKKTKASKAKTTKNKSQKNGQPKVSQPSNQKHAHNSSPKKNK